MRVLNCTKLSWMMFAAVLFTSAPLAAQQGTVTPNQGGGFVETTQCGWDMYKPYPGTWGWLETEFRGGYPNGLSGHRLGKGMTRTRPRGSSLMDISSEPGIELSSHECGSRARNRVLPRRRFIFSNPREPSVRWFFTNRVWQRCQPLLLGECGDVQRELHDGGSAESPVPTGRAWVQN